MTLDEAAAELRKNLMVEERRMVADLERQGWSRSDVDQMVKLFRDTNGAILDNFRGGRLN